MHRNWRDVFTLRAGTSLTMCEIRNDGLSKPSNHNSTEVTPTKYKTDLAEPVFCVAPSPWRVSP